MSFNLDLRPLKHSNSLNASVKSIELPSYKYFKDLVLKLFEAQKVYGAPIDQALNEVKKSLSKDIYFEKKIQASLIGGLYQMGIISFTGFLFILMSCQQLQLRFPMNTFLVALGLNIIGILIYYTLYIYLKHKSFYSLEQIVKSCYVLRAYLRCQMPVVTAINKVALDALVVSSKESYLLERIEAMLQKIKKEGFLNFKDFDMQIDEIWLLFEFKFESFQKQLGALKLLIMTMFFLTAYLYVIYSFIGMIKI